jgi:hypothetical protein
MRRNRASLPSRVILVCATSHSNSELGDVTQYKKLIQAIQCGTPVHAKAGTLSRIGKNAKIV